MSEPGSSASSLLWSGSPSKAASQQAARRRSSLTDESPPEYLCPITCELMSDPVMVSTGQTYERSSIRKWIADGHRSCPVTRLPLSDVNLVPNYALRHAIRAWASRRGLTLDDPEPAPPSRPCGTTYRPSGHSTQSSSTNTVWDTSLPAEDSPALQSVVQLYKGTSEDKDAAVLQLCMIANEGLENGRYLVVQAGGVPPLIVAILKGSDFAKDNAARCLRYLCRSNNPIISQSCSAAIPGLLTLLSEGSRGAKESACGALVNLSAKTDVNKYMIAAAGGIDQLVALLSAEAPRVVSGLTHECAAAVLCNLAFNNQNRAEIAQKGAIPLLVKVVQNVPTPDAPEYAIHALGSLACEIIDNGRRIVEADALPILIQILQRGNQWAKEAASRCIRNISFFDELRPRVIEAGAIPALNNVAEVGSARAAESSRAALNNLTQRGAAAAIPSIVQQDSTPGLAADNTRGATGAQGSRPVTSATTGSRAAATSGVSGGNNPEGARSQTRSTTARLRGSGSRVFPEATAPTGSQPSSNSSSTRRMVVRSTYRSRNNEPTERN